MRKGILGLALVGALVAFLGVRGSAFFSFSSSSVEMAGVGHSLSALGLEMGAGRAPLKPLDEVRAALVKLAPQMNQKVIDAVMMTLKCADKNFVDHNQILAVIDYSMPSNEKRLWVFDLSQNKLLFNTYVGHGIQSGTLLTTYFSNKVNGKASCMGVFNTDKAYRGRHGQSLKLYGLDKNFNDNAYNRFIVMHGGWYAEEWFIKKYGRPGRSWGCPVLPLDLAKPIIETIKDQALLVVYYPNPNWLRQSKFLNCEMVQNTVPDNLQSDAKPPETSREAILFVDLNNDGKRTESKPVIVISADNYKQIYKKAVPLERMLRRQINQVEYVALTPDELKQLGAANAQNVYFVIPDVKMIRGYYVTEMKVVALGKVKDISATAAGNYTINFEGRSPLSVKSDDKFIRWIGL